MVILQSTKAISAAATSYMMAQLQRSPAKNQVNRSTNGHITYGRARGRVGSGGIEIVQASNRSTNMDNNRVPAGPRADVLMIDDDVTGRSSPPRDYATELPNTGGGALNEPEAAQEVVKVEATGTSYIDAMNESNGDSLREADERVESVLASPNVADGSNISGCIIDTTLDTTSQSSFCASIGETASKTDSGNLSEAGKPMDCDLKEELNAQPFEDAMETEDESEDDIKYGTPSFNGYERMDIKEEGDDKEVSTADPDIDTKNETGSKTDSTFMVSSEPMKVPRNLQNHFKAKQIESQSSRASYKSPSTEMNITFDVDRLAPGVNPNVLNLTYNTGLVAGKIAAAQEDQSKEEGTAAHDASLVSTTPVVLSSNHDSEAIKGLAEGLQRKGKKHYAVPVNQTTSPTSPPEIINSSDSEFEVEVEPKNQKKKKPKTPAQKRDTRADIEALYETENPIQSSSQALVRYEKRVAKQIQDGLLVEKKVSSRNERMAARNRTFSPFSSTPQQTRRKRIIVEEEEIIAKPTNADPKPPIDDCSQEAKDVQPKKERPIPEEIDRRQSNKTEDQPVSVTKSKKKVRNPNNPRVRGRPPKRTPTTPRATEDIQKHNSHPSAEPVVEVTKAVEDAVTSKVTSETTMCEDIGTTTNGNEDEKCTSEVTAAVNDAKLEISIMDEDSHLAVEAAESTTSEVEHEDENVNRTTTNVITEPRVPVFQNMEKSSAVEKADDGEKAQPGFHPPSVSSAPKARNYKRKLNDKKYPEELFEAAGLSDAPAVIDSGESLEEFNFTNDMRGKGKPNRKRRAPTAAVNAKSRTKEEPEVKPEPDISTSRNKRTRRNSTQPIEVPQSPPKRGRERPKRAVPEVQEESDSSQELRRSKRMRKCKQFNDDW